MKARIKANKKEMLVDDIDAMCKLKNSRFLKKNEVLI